MARSLQINVRTDEYGGSVRNRSRFLVRVLDAIREECPLASGFCVGVKLNSSDFVKGGLTEEDALETVRILAEHGGVDFIEISGGSYENAGKSARTLRCWPPAPKVYGPASGAQTPHRQHEC